MCDRFEFEPGMLGQIINNLIMEPPIISFIKIIKERMKGKKLQQKNGIALALCCFALINSVLFNAAVAKVLPRLPN